MIIRADNTLDIQADFSYIASNTSTSDSTLPVKNINPFSSNWAIQIGRTGEQLSEILMLSSGAVSGTTVVTTAGARYPHTFDTPVYAIKYDQLIFKRSTVGTAGTASSIATVSITPDSTFTQYEDTTGATSYAYKVAFRNSVTSEVSSDSSWLTTSGLPFYSKGKIRERIKRKLASSNYIGTDDIVDDWINEWLEQMNNAAVHVDKDYNLGTVDVAFGTSGLGTISNTDFKVATKIEITYDGVNFVPSTRMANREIYTNKIYNLAAPIHYWQGDNVLGVKPEQSGGTARITYAKGMTVLVDDTDTIPFSMYNYSKSFVDYGFGQALVLDQKFTEGKGFTDEAKEGKALFISDISPRDQTGPQFITMDEPLSIDNDYADTVF